MNFQRFDHKDVTSRRPQHRQPWTDNNRQRDRDNNHTDRRSYYDNLQTVRQDSRHRQTSLDRHRRHDMRSTYSRDRYVNKGNNRDGYVSERNNRDRGANKGNNRDRGVRDEYSGRSGSAYSTERCGDNRGGYGQGDGGGGRGCADRSFGRRDGGGRGCGGRDNGGRGFGSRSGEDRYDGGSRGGDGGSFDGGRAGGDRGGGGRDRESHYEKHTRKKERDGKSNLVPQTSSPKTPEKPVVQEISEVAHYPELWSTHMTDGDHAQIRQWELESRDHQTEVCSSVIESKNVSDTCTRDHKTETRKRPLSGDNDTDKDEPPRKRPAIYVNRYYPTYNYLNRSASGTSNEYYYYY